ncbi:NAD(P)-dependent oxidoreductase [Paroceanicella profunda]|uniref:NAD(P)-dependent oxidoreductase n=1 Tax=Paroceanicella profunda TaxID=2579971 RepID=A0A5B8FX71_9RHOB|nr:NAD(P)-dependent oxidoreductase [Paroceanicella profunda]QDL93506.1 NAD(P)-dependent oxidoreductase [Paroceanicella profunda]
MNIGFIGLGVMGGPMAGHLAAAGHRVRGFDLTPGAAAARGLETAESAADAARDADVVFTMLPHGGAVRGVVEESLAGAMAPGALLVDCSSAEPWLTTGTAALLEARGVGMVDAPVSGAGWGAEAGELVFMCGGAEADMARIAPLLDAMGRKTFHVGPLGAGHAMKTINNVITAMAVVSTTEAMLIGKAWGLIPSVMADVLNVSTGQSFWTTERLHQDVLNRKFEDGFKLELMLKDVRIANRLGRDQGLDLPMLALGERLWEQADRDLGPARAVTEMVRWCETQIGGTLRDD